MTGAGWCIMLISVIGMTSLFAWCIRKVLTVPDASEHVHSPSDIDPHDQEK